MKTERHSTEPMAFGFLAGALVLILGLYASACNPPHYPHETATRDLAAQYASAVAITANCLELSTGTVGGWYGSGVIVNDHTVLTAGHVVEAEGYLCTWEGVLSDGTKVELKPGYVDHDADLAAMHSSTKMKALPVSYAGMPPLGSEVCESASHPKVVHRCGEVEPSEEGYIVTDMLVDHGNSGAGVYDEDGHLVGITTRLVMCGNRQYCGGWIAKLDGHLELLLV